MDKNKRRRSIIAILIVVIIVTTSFSIFFAYQKFKPVPAYEFKTGINHPQAIRDLMNKSDTVVLFFTTEHEGGQCPSCDIMEPKMADLQSQYNGKDVTFVTLDAFENTTYQSISRNYGINAVPLVFVIRSDGAVAPFFGTQDINTIKSAIEDARHGKVIFPF